MRIRNPWTPGSLRGKFGVVTVQIPCSDAEMGFAILSPSYRKTVPFRSYEGPRRVNLKPRKPNEKENPEMTAGHRQPAYEAEAVPYMAMELSDGPKLSGESGRFARSPFLEGLAGLVVDDFQRYSRMNMPVAYGLLPFPEKRGWISTARSSAEITRKDHLTLPAITLRVKACVSALAG